MNVCYSETAPTQCWCSWYSARMDNGWSQTFPAPVMTVCCSEVDPTLCWCCRHSAVMDDGWSQPPWTARCARGVWCMAGMVVLCVGCCCTGSAVTQGVLLQCASWASHKVMVMVQGVQLPRACRCGVHHEHPTRSWLWYRECSYPGRAVVECIMMITQDNGYGTGSAVTQGVPLWSASWWSHKIMVMVQGVQLHRVCCCRVHHDDHTS